MRYIGSKKMLAPWLFEVISENTSKDLSNVVFADMFAGTGQVARYFKDKVKTVITNDLEDYSYYLNLHYIGNTKNIQAPELSISPKNGIITSSYSPMSDIGRMYFTTENAMLIDGARQEIERLKGTKQIDESQYTWLMVSLIEAADSVGNTTSVYSAYLKQFQKSAIKPLDFKLVDYTKTDQENIVLKGDANENIKKVSGDILYLDPPYNARQYGANYHVLNKIVDYKSFHSDKITGVDIYNKSKYCKKNEVADTFEDLIKNADFEHIFISYNDEGLLSQGNIKGILERFGKYKLETKAYKRFKSKSIDRVVRSHTFEHLHCLTKH